MKDLYKLEKKSKVTSYAGELKMVKVRRGRRGHQKSRSLVFRISRISKSKSMNSGIVEFGSPETEMSDERLENPPGPLKIKIPKSVLNEIKEDEPNVNKYNSSEDLASKYKAPNSEDQHSEAPNSNTDRLNFNVGVLNADLTQSIPETEDTKSCELRRSSRRTFLRLQKDSQSNSSTNQITSVERKLPVVSSNNGQLGSTGDKRKRGRRPGPRATECKKRKYTRRGRPPKSSLPKNLSFIKPIIIGNALSENEKMFRPPKNSVWTLVPKKLLESDFFKSQIRKVHVSSSTEKIFKTQVLTSPNFSPSTVTLPVPFNKGKVQLKYTPLVVNNIPTVRNKTPDVKRPTVIYFKTEKKNFDYPVDQQDDFSNTRPQFNNDEYSKTQNDLYLFDKYRMLEDTVLKNYYEVTNCDLNETDNMQSDLLSSNPVTSTQQDSSISVSQSDLSNESVLDLSSSDVSYSNFEIKNFSCDDVNDVDTLSRSLIVESLRILNCEEAVLL